MYILVEYSEMLWQCCRYELALNNDPIVNFNVANVIADSFKIKEKITGQTGNDSTKKVKMMILLKYLKLFLKLNFSG